jgi:lipopolysaccharide export LptBFGC system permease protein LptF
VFEVVFIVVDVLVVEMRVVVVVDVLLVVDELLVVYVTVDVLIVVDVLLVLVVIVDVVDVVSESVDENMMPAIDMELLVMPSMINLVAVLGTLISTFRHV